MFQQISLPALPEDLTNRLIDHANASFYDEGIQQLWRTTRAYPFTEDTIKKFNIVERVSYNIETYLDELKEIIQPHLPIEAIWALFVMKNNDLGRKAIFPAHTDRKRGVALSYVLQTGGTHTQVHFHTDAPVIQNTFFNEIESPIVQTFDTHAGAWYALSATDVHSVTGIEDTRILFTLSPVDQTLSFTEFVSMMK